jgi:hypothetical protein
MRFGPVEKYDTVLLKGVAHLPVRRDFQGIDRNFHVGLESRHRTTIDADLAREIELLHPDQRAAGPDHAARGYLVAGHCGLRIEIQLTLYRMAVSATVELLHNTSYGIYIPYDSYRTQDPQVTQSDLIAAPTSAPGRGFTAATVFIDGNPSGMRLVKLCGSRLSILVLPFAELARLKERLSPWDYVVYVIDDPSPTSNQKTYIGHGDGERKFGDRLGNAISATTQIYVVIAAGDTFDKVTAPYVEARLIGICTDLNIPLANSGRPFGRGLGIIDDLEQLVGHAETLLSVAGFTRIEIARQNPPALRLRLSVTTDRDEMVAMTEDEKAVVPQKGVAYRLGCRDLHAVGFAWNDRFYVMAGSDYARRSRSDLSYDHQRRRDLLEAEKWVGPATGMPDRMTLKVGFHCRSGAFAAKLLSGEHIDEDSWLAVETTATNCEAPA